jgi:hypothetical protein
MMSGTIGLRWSARALDGAAGTGGDGRIMMGERLIGEVTKNTLESIRVRVVDSPVGPYVDVRVWATPRPGDAPGLHPTSKALMIAPELADDLAELIQEAARAARSSDE